MCLAESWFVCSFSVGSEAQLLSIIAKLLNKHSHKSEYFVCCYQIRCFLNHSPFQSNHLALFLRTTRTHKCCSCTASNICVVVCVVIHAILLHKTKGAVSTKSTARNVVITKGKWCKMNVSCCKGGRKVSTWVSFIACDAQVTQISWQRSWVKKFPAELADKMDVKWPKAVKW